MVKRTSDIILHEAGGVGQNDEWTQDQLEFASAMERYKRTRHRPFPTCREILEVLLSLGYQKVATARPLPVPVRAPRHKDEEAILKAQRARPQARRPQKERVKLLCPCGEQFSLVPHEWRKRSARSNGSPLCCSTVCRATYNSGGTRKP